MTQLAILLMTLAAGPAAQPPPPAAPPGATSPEPASPDPASPAPGEPTAPIELDPATEPDPSPTPTEPQIPAPDEPPVLDPPPSPEPAPPMPADVGDEPEADEVDKADESAGPETTKKADETKKTKKKGLAWSIGARIMGGWEVEHRRPVEAPEETTQVPFLRQARVKLRLDYKERFNIRTSIELADALRAPNFDRVSYLRNAYGQVRFHDAARLRFGYFKRPFSRLELRSPSDLPIRGRGLANGRIIEDRNYGDRSVGTMMWGEIDPARLKWYVGAFAPALRAKGVDVVGRVQADPLPWLSLGAGGGYKRIDNGLDQTVDVSSFGADFRVRYEGLYLLGDLVMGQDYLVPGEPFALGLVGYASYDVDLPKKLVLQPVVLVEWADANIEVSQNDAIRFVGGVNLRWRKRFRVMPQVELVRPRGVIDNPWTNKDAYYVMLSLDL